MKQVDIKWILVSLNSLKYDEFTHVDEIIEQNPQIYSFRRLDGKLYGSSLAANMQSNLDKYSILSDGNYPVKNKTKNWSFLTKEAGSTSYKKSDDFESQYKVFSESNVGLLSSEMKRLREYTNAEETKVLSSINPEKGIKINEKSVLILSDEKSMYVKKVRDNSFIKVTKELFFKTTDGRCSSCNYSFMEEAGVHYIELHHKVPFSNSENIERTYHSLEEIMEDFEFLCSNCHTIRHLKF